MACVNRAESIFRPTEISFLFNISPKLRHGSWQGAQQI